MISQRNYKFVNIKFRQIYVFFHEFILSVNKMIKTTETHTHYKILYSNPDDHVEPNFFLVLTHL